MPMLKGKKAVLLAEGCKLKKEIRAREERLKEIKKQINLKETGTYRNEAGDTLVVSETEKFTDIAPKNVLNYLKKNGMISRFPEVVKVQLTPLRKLVPEKVINRWRKPLGSITRYSWK